MRARVRHCGTCACVEQHPLHPVVAGRGHGLQMRNTTHTLAVMQEAGQTLRRAVALGILERPTTCQCCGSTPRSIEAAHYDYRAPLVVLWLCHSCHRLWDNAVPKWATLPGEVNDPAI